MSAARPTLRLVSAKELAAIVDVNVWTAYDWARTGKVPSYKLGHTVRFDLNEVLEALRRPVRDPRPQVAPAPKPRQRRRLLAKADWSKPTKEV